MKTKIVLLFSAILAVNLSFGQIVFEKDIYPASSSEKGDIEQKDMIISEINDTSDLISTGYYHFKQDSASASFWAVLSSSDTLGAKNFEKRYLDS